MRRLAYHSRANGPVSYGEAANIAAEASRNNALNAIFGLLILRDGRFFQMLEGDGAAIDELYDRLLADQRHGNLTIVLNEAIETPAFHSFAMPLFCEEDGDRLLARLGEEAVPDHATNLIRHYAVGCADWDTLPCAAG